MEIRVALHVAPRDFQPNIAAAAFLAAELFSLSFQIDRLGVIRLSAGAVALVRPHDAAVLVYSRFGALRHEFDDLGLIGNRQVVLFLNVINQSHASKGESQIEIGFRQGYCSLVVVQGLFQLPHCPIQVAPIAENGVVLGIEIDGLCQIIECLVVFTLIGQGVADPSVGRRSEVGTVLGVVYDLGTRGNGFFRLGMAM